METAIAGRQAFLDVFCSGKRRFDVRSFGGLAVRIRSLYQGEISAQQMEGLDAKGNPIRARQEDSERRLVQKCVVDADGNLLLQPADVAALAQADPALFYRLYDFCATHCGLKRDVDPLEAERKNSDAAPSGDSRDA